MLPKVLLVNNEVDMNITAARKKSQCAVFWFNFFFLYIFDNKNLHAHTDKLFPAAMQLTQAQRDKECCSENIKGSARDYYRPLPLKKHKHIAVKRQHPSLRALPYCACALFF